MKQNILLYILAKHPPMSGTQCSVKYIGACLQVKYFVTVSYWTQLFKSGLSIRISLSTDLFGHCSCLGTVVYFLDSTHSNVITHCDVTIDVPSNIITHCDFTVCIPSNVITPSWCHNEWPLWCHTDWSPLAWLISIRISHTCISHKIRP